MNNLLADSIRKVACFLLTLLMVLIFYLTYIQFYEGSFLSTHSLNRRSALLMKQVERGEILDKSGKILAQSHMSADGYVRDYPQGRLFAQLVGYDNDKLGKTGIESVANGELSGMSDPWRHLGAMSHFLYNRRGHTVILNVDTAVQRVAYRALGNHKGAVVAIAPKTGEILALVTKPAFNPNHVDEEWQSIVNSPDSPLMNRAVQGLYPPGSTMKVVTAEAALFEHITDTKKIYRSEGMLKIPPDYVLHEDDDKVYGNLTLKQAFTVSSNVVFGKLALEMGGTKLAKAYERFGFQKSLDPSIGETMSRIPDFSQLSNGDLAQSGIGQASLLVTPLRMAMLASAIANQGKLMEPYLINKIVDSDGNIVKQYSPHEWLTTTSPEIAILIKQMMVSVVDNGTGRGAGLPGVAVAGKTGTAENPHGQPHAWFIGFAPADNPVVAVAVIVENGGGGGEIAAPVARQIFSELIH